MLLNKYILANIVDVFSYNNITQNNILEVENPKKNKRNTMNREKSKLQKNAAKDTTPKASQLLNALTWKDAETKKRVSPKVRRLPTPEAGKIELIDPKDENVFLSKDYKGKGKAYMTVKRLSVPNVPSEPLPGLVKLRAAAAKEGVNNE